MLVFLVDLAVANRLRSVNIEVRPTKGVGACSDLHRGEPCMGVTLVCVDAVYVNMLSLCKVAVVSTIELVGRVESVRVAGYMVRFCLFFKFSSFLKQVKLLLMHKLKRLNLVLIIEADEKYIMPTE